MPFPRPCLARILPSVLVPFIGCSMGLAQIHEETQMPGLEEGILVHFEKDVKRTFRPEAGSAIGTGDFSVACQLTLPQGPPFIDGTIGIVNGSENVASHDSQGAAWRLLLGSDGALSFVAWPKSGAETMKIDTPKGAVIWGRAHDIVVSVHRDARQPLSGIWVDGIEIASGTCAPVDLRSSLPGGDWGSSDWIRSVTVYNRAISRPEILDLSMRSSASSSPKPRHPAPPPDGPGFVPQPDESIALLGGTEAVALAESGELEALLLMAFPQTRFHFRSLAWEGDTVFRQDRPMNFGSLEQQLRRVNAGAVFMMFGRQECLDGPSGDTTEFAKAAEGLIERVSSITGRIVIVAPREFFKPAPVYSSYPDQTAKNQRIAAVREVLRMLAAKHAAWFADPEACGIFRKGGYSRDGVNFDKSGLGNLAMRIEYELKFSKEGIPYEVNQRLAPLLATKNRLWHDYWRPSNWAFLHGDRTNQPSSRDPVDPQIRFFPSEQEKYLPLIKDAEDKVFQLVQEAQKKLP